MFPFWIHRKPAFQHAFALLEYLLDKIKVQGPFEEAARRAFPQESLRANLPELWRIKLGLEAKYPVTLQDWRSEAAALQELAERFEKEKDHD